VTFDSKSFVVLLAILQIGSAALFFTSKIRGSFAVGALTPLLVLLVAAASWTGITRSEVIFVIGGLVVLSAAILGAMRRGPVPMWWIVWVLNLVTLGASVYFTFFFHLF